jgi:chitinase
MPTYGKSQALTMYSGQASSNKVLCYFSNWAGMRDGDGKFVPENIPAEKCTHVVYAFAKLDENELSPAPSGPLADINEDFYARVVKTVKQKNPSAKVLISVGGWADSAGDKYSKLVSKPESINKFVKNTRGFLKVHGFDGIVMEWHFPVCWQSDCSRGPSSDRAAFTRLMVQLKKSLGKDYVVGATVSGYESVINKAYDVSTLSNNLDFLNIMAYDMHGFWDGMTNHHAPLRSSPGPSVVSFTLELYVKLSKCV